MDAALQALLADLTPYAVGAISGAFATMLVCVVAGCFSRKYPAMPPLRPPSAHHRIEPDRRDDTTPRGV